MSKSDQVVKALARSGAMDVARSLRYSGKSQQQMVYDVKTPLSNVQRALEGFQELGIAKKIENAGPKKADIYELTPLGHQVLEKIEEIEELLTESKEPESELRYVGKEEVD